MRYIMKQRFFSFTDSFSIWDEQEREAFQVEGQVFSFGHKLSLQDNMGNELAFIKQKLLTWTPTYEIYRNGELFAVIEKELFGFFKCRFNIELASGEQMTVEGDFFDHEYQIEKNGYTIATISKAWFSWTDSYGIDIADQEDDATILACMVAVDLACHHENN